MNHRGTEVLQVWDCRGFGLKDGCIHPLDVGVDDWGGVMVVRASCRGLEEKGVQGQRSILGGAAPGCTLWSWKLGDILLFGLVEKRRHLLLGDGGDALGRVLGRGDGVGDSPILYWREGDNVILLLV